MIKPYSKSKLKIFIRIFFWSFSSSSLKQVCVSYLKTLGKDIDPFVNKIKGYQIYSESEQENLKDLYSQAVFFRANKKFWKDVIGEIFLFPLFIGICCIPYLIPFFYFKNNYTFWEFVLLYLGTFFCTFLISVIMYQLETFFDHFKMKLGQKTPSFIIYFLLFCLIFTIPFVINIKNSIISNSIINSISIMYFFILLQMISYILSVIVDFKFYSRKIQITDALIIESCFKLSSTNWKVAIRKKKNRQNAILEIERLASLIENDWSVHMKAKDERNNIWKTKTLSGIADGIRYLKREVMIPSSNSALHLEEKFNSILIKILNHDLVGLIGSEVPSVRIRKTSKFNKLKSVFVAFIPLLITISFKLFPIKEVPINYINWSVVFSLIWLFISMMIWLDPNLAEKISTFKSAKGFIKND